MTPATSIPHRRSRAARVLGIASALLLAASASAEMMQIPLQAQSGAGVPPNLVFTLDDSGSMWWECIPDALCVSAAQPHLGFEAIPQRRSVSMNNLVGTMYYDDVPIENSDGTPPGAPPEAGYAVFSRRMRANSANPLYYNPAVRYKPWLNSDGTRWPDAVLVDGVLSNPISAPVIPGSATRQVLQDEVTIDHYWWCYDHVTGNCPGEKKQTAVIARYYNLGAGKTGNFKNDWILKKIETSNNSYPKAADRTDCAGTTCTYLEEIRNFANWYTYYRTRALTAIAGTAEAFAGVPETYRVGYGRINNDIRTDIDGQQIKTLERGVRPFSGSDRTQFYNWLFNRTKPSGGTPLRRALDDVGQYFSKPYDVYKKGPWSNTPGTDDPTPPVSCRRAIHVLMTDGQWNQDSASTVAAKQNVDNTDGPEITGPDGEKYQYKPAAPFKDSYADTLADVSMYYWNRDLQPGLENNLRPSGDNPAFWQHMTNFTIAFGVSGTLANPGDLAALSSGSKSWPDLSSESSGTRTDDLWHAALNSRGRSASARNAGEYAKALTDIVEQVKSMSGSQAGAATSTTTLPSVDATGKKYTPTFTIPGSTGDIKAQRLDSNGVAGEVLWSAAAALGQIAPTDRKIYTWDPAKQEAIAFQWAGLSNDQKTRLSADETAGEALVSYLRGDRTGEGSAVRARQSLLGDIVNSTPRLVSNLVNLGYHNLPTGPGNTAYGAAGYRKYIRAKALRTPQLVAGANDGMLHFFSDTNGAETFAFVPNAVLGSLGELAELNYTHRYFVDGPIHETDVFDGTSGHWTNLVQGTGGAGGKYLYTIRVPVPYWNPASETAPGTLSAADSAPKAGDVLWEIDSSMTDFAQLGHVLSQPETGVTPDGTWVTIFGNGYESDGLKAQLFIVNALTGALVKKIDTGVGSNDQPNGLGGVAVLRDAHKRIVAVYAGDLQGNLWKFDLASSNPTNWSVAFGGSPLYRATHGTGANTEAEPITAAPVLRSFSNAGDTMILFGTGRLYASGDENDGRQQALYGIRDVVPAGAQDAGAVDAVPNSNALVTQQIVEAPVGTSGGATYRTFTLSKVDYALSRGWRMPLTLDTGERLIDTPQLVSSMVFMQTVIPSPAIDQCNGAGISRRGYVLDPFMSGAMPQPFASTPGGELDSSIIDLSGAGKNSILVRRDLGSGVIANEFDTPDRGPKFLTTTARRSWRHISPPRH